MHFEGMKHAAACVGSIDSSALYSFVLGDLCAVLGAAYLSRDVERDAGGRCERTAVQSSGGVSRQGRAA